MRQVTFRLTMGQTYSTFPDPSVLVGGYLKISPLGAMLAGVAGLSCPLLMQFSVISLGQLVPRISTYKYQSPRTSAIPIHVLSEKPKQRLVLSYSHHDHNKRIHSGSPQTSQFQGFFVPYFDQTYSSPNLNIRDQFPTFSSPYHVDKACLPFSKMKPLARSEFNIGVCLSRAKRFPENKTAAESANPY